MVMQDVDIKRIVLATLDEIGYSVEPLMTMQDLERILKVDASTINRAIREGDFPRCIRVRRQARWPRHIISKWINQGGGST